jgi:Methyltransferase domain
MDLKRAKGIKGWMSLMELTFLAEQAGKSKIIVEVGSWFGRSCRAMADNTHGIIYAVDMWDVTQLTPFVQEFVKGWVYDQPKDYAWVEFNKNLSDHISGGRVRPVRLSSVEAAEQFDQTCDFIFIDADHEYDSVVADIKAWLPKTKGIMSGHDWHLPDVQRAVRDTIGEPNEVTDTIWSKRV